jgi:hypothetical protein
MDLSYAEVGYFITQVADSAASFGVANDDLTVVGNALTSLFDVRCSAPTTVVPAQGAALQAICIDPTCPLAPNATCSAYGNATEPAVAISSLVPSMSATGTVTSASSPTSSGAVTSSPSAPTTGAGVTYGLSMAAVAAGFAAMLL